MTALPRPYVPYRETEKRIGDIVYDSIKREFIRIVAPAEKRVRRK